MYMGGLMERTKKERYKNKLLRVMVKHIGKTNSISMSALYEAVFGEPCRDKINETRIIRRLITELRRDGVPICSDTDSEGGGYYLAAAGGELENYCMRLRIRALKTLRMEAILRKMTLPELIGQLNLNVGGKK